jgi:multimeric flavodoxin WrbA
MGLETRTEPGQKKILALGASPRKGGNCDILLQHFALGASRAGVDTEIIQLRDLSISPCVGCELCRKVGSCKRFEDDMVAIYPKIIAARGLILVSPVHNYNVTAWMKAFIDRLYCFYNFVDPRPGPWSSKLADQDRKALVAAVSEQKEKKEMGFTLEAMEWPLAALGYDVQEQFPVLGTFTRGQITTTPDYLKNAENSAEKMARALL